MVAPRKQTINCLKSLRSLCREKRDKAKTFALTLILRSPKQVPEAVVEETDAEDEADAVEELPARAVQNNKNVKKAQKDATTVDEAQHPPRKIKTQINVAMEERTKTDRYLLN